MKDLFRKINDLFLKSPIRLLLDKGNHILMKTDTTEFDEVIKDYEILNNRIDQALNILILGEVKSGKSTFINALIGREISPVGISETTSSIIEICYGSSNEGIIIKDNNDTIHGSLKEIVEILNLNDGKNDFYNSVVKVQFTLQEDRLKKLHLIDTPGLATINEANINRTKDFVQNADIIFWVFNANYLGQTDINNELKDIAKLGKPLVAIINKIDEVDTDKNELIKFLDSRLGVYFEHIFPLSALESFKSVDNSIKDFSVITKYISQLETNANKAHEKSIKSSLFGLLKRDMILHELYLKELELIIEQITKFENKIIYHNQRIKDIFNNKLSNWYENDFLANEEQEVINIIDSSKLFQIVKSKISMKINNIFSKDNINHILENERLLLSKALQDEWKLSIEEVTDSFSKEFNKLKSQFISHHQNKITDMTGSSDSILERARKGAIIGGTLGVIQGAILASTAAITMSIFFITIPVFLTAGLLTGSITKLFDYKQNKNKLRKKVEEIFSNTKQNNSIIEVISQFHKEIIKNCDNLSEELIEQFHSNLFSNFSRNVLNQFDNDITKYVLQLKKEIELYKYNA